MVERLNNHLVQQNWCTILHCMRTIKYIRIPSIGLLKHMADRGSMSEICKITGLQDCSLSIQNKS